LEKIDVSKKVGVPSPAQSFLRRDPGVRSSRVLLSEVEAMRMGDMRTSLWLPEPRRGVWDLAWVGLVLALGGAPSASARNLIDNSGFDDDAAGWASNTGGVALDWISDLDVAEDPDSGSARVMSSNSNVAVRQAMLSCIAVAPGVEHSIGIDALFPSEQTETDVSVSLAFMWRSTSTCSGTILGIDSAPSIPGVPDVWHRLSEEVVAPDGANSVLFMAGFVFWSKNAPDGSFEVFFDDAYIIELPEPSHGVLHAAAIATLGMLGRKRQPLRRGSCSASGAVSRRGAGGAARVEARPGASRGAWNKSVPDL
jgi:hypothetical protein